MNDEFVKGLYSSIVEEGTSTYKYLFDTTKVTGKITEYWKNALLFYHSQTDSEKEIFFAIIKQVIVDSVSSVLGVLDGTSNLDGADLTFEVLINGENTNDELQDAFLGYIEDNM